MLVEHVMWGHSNIKYSYKKIECPPTSIPASSYIFFLTVQMDCKTQFKCRLEIVHSAELPNRKENKEYGALSSVLGWPCLILILHRLRMKTGAEWLNKTKQKKTNRRKEKYMVKKRRYMKKSVENWNLWSTEPLDCYLPTERTEGADRSSNYMLDGALNTHCWFGVSKGAIWGQASEIKIEREMQNVRNVRSQENTWPWQVLSSAQLVFFFFVSQLKLHHVAETKRPKGRPRARSI